MKASIFLLTCACFLLIYDSLNPSGFVFGQNPTINRTSVGKKVRQIYGYRKVQFCVTGYDEPELHEWPFNQFIHLLRRSWERFHVNENFRYSLKLLEIKTEQTAVGYSGGLYKTIHIIITAETKRDVLVNIEEQWDPFEVEGYVLQANTNPESLGFPIGQFFDINSGEITCTDCQNQFQWSRSIPCRKRAVIDMEHPSVLIFHHEMLPRKYVKLGETVGRQHEVHANFRWYNTPCAETRRLYFYLLAVRSFTDNQYDVVGFGPYEVAVRNSISQSEIHPSPVFEFYTKNSICHDKRSQDVQKEHPEKFLEFEMSSKFDCCIKNEENPKDPLLKEYTETEIKPTFSCAAAGKDNPYTTVFTTESWQCYFPPPIKCRSNSLPEKADKVFQLCAPCVTLPSTTTRVPTKAPTPIIKRTTHGMLMIMTNFCLQPIVIYIARFYKETYNGVHCKGTKTWYWMHMLGGMISSSMVYFGYFSGGSEKDNQAHVILGNIYIIILAVCYMTAWGRNVNAIVNIFMEFIHGCLGYTVIILAMFIIATTPQLKQGSKLCNFMMFGFQGVFMIAMTAHVCCWDQRFGMLPKRRHFPTVEARFDQVKVPGGKFRKLMLTIFWLTTLGLSVTSTFLE